MPTMYYLVGLPGSGKSNFAKLLGDSTGASVYSLNEVRDYCHSIGTHNNDSIWSYYRTNIREMLGAGMDVVVDAEYIRERARRHFINPLDCKKVCYIIATPMKICQRNADKKAVWDCYNNWQTPYFWEGWDEVYVYYPNPEYKNLYGFSMGYMGHTWRFDQESPHHHYSLGKHLKLTFTAICSKDGREGLTYPNDDGDGYTWLYTEIASAAAIHDCGKPITKFYDITKQRTTYYNHHNVGAYEALFFNHAPVDDIAYVSCLVNHHMDPFFWEASNNPERDRKRFIHKYGNQFYRAIVDLNQADRGAK